MTKFLTIVIAAAILGLFTFIILYWILSIDRSTSLISAVSIFITGLLLEILKPYFISIDKKQKENIQKRVIKNLGKRNKQIQH